MSTRPPSRNRERRLITVLAAIGILFTTIGTIHTVSRADAGVLPADAAHDFGRPIWSGDLRGDVTTIGNVVTTCRPGSTAAPTSPGYRGTCEEVLTGAVGGDERTGSAPFPANNEFDLVYVDVDDDPRTHNSSMAVLRTEPGSEIIWAGLHWHGLLEAASSGRANPDWRAPLDPEARFRVTVRTPAGETVDVEAEDRWDQPSIGSGGSGHRSYGAYRDVTDLVRSAGDGAWTVGNVQTCTGPSNALGCIGGWTLTVVHAAADQPARNLNVWHGWDLAHHRPGGTLLFDADGIVPPPAGGEAVLGIVAADGDRGRGPESVRWRTASNPEWTALGGPGRPLHPDDPPEFFNSTIDRFGEPRPDADASPNFRSNLNLDIALVGGIPVSADDGGIQFEIDTTTRRDTIYAQVVHTAVPLFEPEIEIDKTASVDIADPGDVITWTLEIANVGIEPIRDARVTDALPDGLELVADSIRYAEGGPDDLLGPKTADGGDDEATWNAEDGVLTLNVGAAATADAGGVMGVPGAADGSDRITITFDTIWHGDEGTEIVNEAIATGHGRELAEDPFGPITTEDRDRDRVVGRLLPLLRQDKTVDRARLTPGEEAVFELTVENRGRGVADAGATVVDEVPEGVEVIATSPDSVFDEESRTLTWTDLPALESGEVWEARVRVSVEAGRWDERFVNRLLVHPPPEVPVEVDHPCEDDPTRSCAEITTPATGWVQGKKTAPDTPETVEIGSEVEFDLLVRNSGEVAGAPTAVDRLPDRLIFVSASHDGVYDEEEHRIVWADLDELEPGQEISLRLVARVGDGPRTPEDEGVGSGGGIVNRFRIDPPADQPDPEVHDVCEDDDRWSCAEIRTPEPAEPAPPVRPSAPPPARSTPAPPLPRTGTNVLGPGLIALGLLSAGTALLLLRRDRAGFTAPRPVGPVGV